jgi:hypothetical protein
MPELMYSDLLLVPDQGQCYAQAKEAVVQTPNSGSWDHVSGLLPIRVRTDGKGCHLWLQLSCSSLHREREARNRMLVCRLYP